MTQIKIFTKCGRLARNKLFSYKLNNLELMNTCTYLVTVCATGGELWTVQQMHSTDNR